MGKGLARSRKKKHLFSKVVILYEINSDGNVLPEYTCVSGYRTIKIIFRFR